VSCRNSRFSCARILLALVKRTNASSLQGSRQATFLAAALAELAGVAEVSFEGDLSRTSLFDVAGASSDETQILKRNTLWPKQDFVVLPLESEMIGPIMAAVGGTVPRGIIHIQVQKDGRLELGLYDNFAPKFMFFGPRLTSTFLATLQDAGTLAHWTKR
jgi:hypothetical protein